MLTCLAGDRWFPLTAQVGFFHAPLRQVRKKLVDFSGRSAEVAEFADLDSALAGCAPYPFGRGQTWYLLPSAGDTWTTALSSAAPSADVGFYLSTRAALDVGCDFVAAEWVPRGPGLGGAEAKFVDYRHERQGLFGSGKGWHSRSRRVHVTRQERGWTFDALGPVRDFEDPSAYERTQKAQRLPMPLLAGYARAAGVAVDDPGWLDGPVHTATHRRPGPVVEERTWSTVVELRALCGYPATGVPQQL